MKYLRLTWEVGLLLLLMHGARSAFRTSVPARPALAATRPGASVAVTGLTTRSEVETQVAAPAGLGWLPSLTLVGALGLFGIAQAYNAAREQAWGADLLYWAGLLVLFVPIAVRLGGTTASRAERIGLIALLGLGLYLVKVLHSPLQFTFSDEFAHWRTVSDILRTGQLYHENPLIVVSAFYPGLEGSTAALVSLAGLGVFEAGLLLLGLARVAFVLGLYLFYEQVGGSARVAGIAALLYMANPNFVFFSSQFSYESLSLPLAVFTLWAAARRARAVEAGRVGLTLAVLLGLGAVVVTHHLTAYALAAFLALWTAVAIIRRRSGGTDEGPGGAALLALVAALAWLIYIASLTVGYLAPNLGGGVAELVRLVKGEIVGRQLFRSASGQAAPLWEQVAGFGSVLLILLGLPFGLFQVWRRYRAGALALALGVAALAYPASLALRLTPRGAETSNRASEFLFLAIAFVLAVAVVDRWLGVRASRPRTLAFTTWATVIFVGGVIVGWGPWARLPGPYLVAADTRSIEPQGLTAAEWARDHLGPGNRMIADRTNRLLMGSLGEQRPVTIFADGVNTPAVLFATELGEAERTILERGRIRHVVVDRRLNLDLPTVGVYVEQGEPDTFRHRMPLNPHALAKFDGLDGVSRVFDSGDIAIYDVEGLVDAR